MVLFKNCCETTTNLLTKFFPDQFPPAAASASSARCLALSFFSCSAACFSSSTFLISASTFSLVRVVVPPGVTTAISMFLDDGSTSSNSARKHNLAVSSPPVVSAKCFSSHSLTAFEFRPVALAFHSE